ncbi:hypothetical protein [Nostocoides veronense]|uniref:Uncharacterized protein n=1 Tax=Nostocoides veronense TaxID=330836 RepID=A0ABP4Y7S3_9MICO
MSQEIMDLLERASADVPEVDLAASAWAEAGRRRARRRMAWGSGGLAAIAASAVGVAVLAGGREVAQPPATQTTTSTPRVAGELLTTELPDPGKVERLPAYADFEIPGLSGSVDLLKDAQKFSQTTGFAPGEQIVAAFSEAEPPQVGVVTSTGRILVFDDLSLVAQTDAEGNSGFGLSTAAIGADRTALVISQPTGLLVIDSTQSGRRPWRTIPVPDTHLGPANFLDAGPIVVTSSGPQNYLVDITTGEVRKSASGWPGGRVILSGGGDLGPITAEAYDPTIGAFTKVPVPPERRYRIWVDGPDTATWTSAATDLADRSRDGFQGVMAMRYGTSPSPLPAPVVLADASGFDADGTNRSKGGVQPLAWLTEDVLLVSAGGSTRYPATDLVAWNVRTQDLRYVASLTGMPVQLVMVGQL